LHVGHYKSLRSGCSGFYHSKLRRPQGEGGTNVEMYKFSTLSLAQGVRRKNFKDDLIEGLLLKQLMLMRCASSPHP